MNIKFNKNELTGKRHICLTLSIFLSGAMTGLSTEEQQGWRNKIKDWISDNNWTADNEITVYDPTCFDAESKDAKVQENGFNYDVDSIIDSDMVIVNLNKCMTSVGTCQEIMLAWGIGKPILGFWENEEDVVPLHPWIEKELSLKFSNIEALRDYLYEFFNKWRECNE